MTSLPLLLKTHFIPPATEMEKRKMMEEMAILIHSFLKRRHLYDENTLHSIRADRSDRKHGPILIRAVRTSSDLRIGEGERECCFFLSLTPSSSYIG